MAPKRRTFTDQELSFLAAIHEDPKDDTPRLVYADWLEEHGQPEQAEFIRLQCETAMRLEPWSACEYTPRERRLVNRFGARWRGQRMSRDRKMDCLPKHPDYKQHGRGALNFLRFHRGLPDVGLTGCNDSVSHFNMDAVAESAPPHFQLSLYYAVYESNYAKHQGFDPRKLLLDHPVTARAYRVDFRAVAEESDVALPDEFVAAAVEYFRRRKVLYVRFRKVSKKSKSLIENELSPHVHTITLACV